MNLAQIKASNPKHSCWVMASAGTGKTKVLVDRLLRLLLEKNAPKRILCLTYTKAAAKEMMERISGKVQLWREASKDNLIHYLRELGYETITEEHLSTAQNLWKILQTRPLVIQTIHSFCQTLLSYYPEEVNLRPGFDMLDAQGIKKIHKIAVESVLHNHAHLEHFREVSPFMGEGYLRDILTEALCHRLQIIKYSNPIKHLGKILNVDVENSQFSSPHTSLTPHGFQSVCVIAEHSLTRGPKTLHKAAQDILETHGEDDTALFSFFLTKEGEIRKKFVLAGKEIPGVFDEDILGQYAHHVHELHLEAQAREVCDLNAHLHALIGHTFDAYTFHKYTKNTVDFDDLLEKAHNLLVTERGWILNHLDMRFDHILVDEAQDTSPLQWKIIEVLLDHFFETTGENGRPRTLFVVGDVKQSIYSFQGADPHYYQEMGQYFKNLATLNRHPFEFISLDLCYRQAPEILTHVDQVFAAPYLCKSLLTQNVHHTAFRQTHKGEVIVFTEESEDMNPSPPWTLPPPLSQSTFSKTIAHLLDTVKNLLGRYLPSEHRIAAPDDILILFKRRGKLMGELYDALRKDNIPCTSSHNRDFLSPLVIQDLLAILHFLNDEKDDYRLACILKSPLCGLSEHELQTLCVGHKGALLDTLSHNSMFFEAQQKIQNFKKMYEQSEHVFTLCYRLVEFIHMQAPYPPHDLALLDPFLEHAHVLFQRGAYTLQEFLNHIGEYFEDLPLPLSSKETGNVRLMTVHGSKGLEAPIVILADDHTPTLTGQSTFIFGQDFYCLRSGHSPLKHLKAYEKEEDIAESHRLLYVALTRAKDVLIVKG